MAMALCAIALACLMPQRAHAMSVIPLYLDEVIDTSAVIFEGTCVDNRSERDAVTGLVVTHTTFEVRDVLKGGVGRTHTIKQIGGSLPGEALQYRVQGIPRFEPGQDYVVFLAGMSRAGFSSPIGLAQGRFEITNEEGVRRVRNGRDLREMTSRIAAQVPLAEKSRMEKTKGAVEKMDLEDLKQTVRNHRGADR
jgi:hypothetical protein